MSTRAALRVRWHPRAADAASPRRGWVASVSADGGFAVVGARGVVAGPRRSAATRSATSRGDPDPEAAKGTRAATAGADGVARVWDAAEAPTLVAACRGHEGRVLCVAWTADGCELVTGSDDQTVRRWDPEDPSRAPGRRRSTPPRREKRPRRIRPRPRPRTRRSERKGGGEGRGRRGFERRGRLLLLRKRRRRRRTRTRTTRSGPLLSGLSFRASSRAPPHSRRRARSSTRRKRKKKRKGTGGRGLIKPPAWESTPEGIAAGREAAVALARILAARARVGGNLRSRKALPPPDAKRAGYGPEGLGLFLGQAEAMRLLEVEARRGEDGEAAGAAPGEAPPGEGPPGSAPDASGVVGVAHLRLSDASVPGSGAFRAAERVACAAVFRGDFAGAARTLFASTDGPIPSDFFAALVGGGFDAFRAATEAQASRLEAAGEHQRAALALLGVHETRLAIAALKRGGFVRDAAALAAARLHPADPLLSETRRELAAEEERRGGGSRGEGAPGERAARGGGAGAREAGGGGRARRRGGGIACACVGEPEKHAVMRARRGRPRRGDLEDAEGVLRRWIDCAKEPRGAAGPGGRGEEVGGGGGGGAGGDEDALAAGGGEDEARAGARGGGGGRVVKRGRTASADGPTEGEEKETHEKSRQRSWKAFERRFRLAIVPASSRSFA